MDAAATNSDNTEGQLMELEEKDRTSALFKLAKKQGMNTDVRRSIFVVLMSSDVSPYF